MVILLQNKHNLTWFRLLAIKIDAWFVHEVEIFTESELHISC